MAAHCGRETAPEALEAAFKAAMRRLASTVCVVTTPTAQGPRGMTATAVMSLSAKPPTIAVAVNHLASMNPALHEGAAVCVNLLSEDDAALAQDFSGGAAPEQRFLRGDWRRGAGAAPMLGDAAASQAGVVDRRIELATHSLLIIAVRDAHSRPEAAPLLYADGGFTGLNRPAPAATL
jgi:flavin reductase (DIM6/NTAB) family NADH-FMN oxidoreductase RutF